MKPLGFERLIGAVCLQSQSGHFEDKNLIPLLGIEPRIDKPVLVRSVFWRMSILGHVLKMFTHKTALTSAS